MTVPPARRPTERGDDRRRAVERRFRETESLEDEAAWLLEQVRAGELTAERVVLAARLAHPAARRCVALQGDPDSAEDLHAWVQWLVTPAEFAGRLTRPEREFCLEVCARVGLVCAVIVRDLRRLWVRASEREALRAAEDWILCPCPPHALRAGSAAALAASTPDRPGLRLETLPVLVAELASARDPRHAGLLAASCLRRAAGSLGRPDQLVEAVQEELVPWALGRGDPVRERRGRA